MGCSVRYRAPPGGILAKMFSLKLIMSLDLTTSLQGIQGVEYHGKIVHEETGKSMRQDLL